MHFIGGSFWNRLQNHLRRWSRHVVAHLCVRNVHRFRCSYFLLCVYLHEVFFLKLVALFLLLVCWLLFLLYTYLFLACWFVLVPTLHFLVLFPTLFFQSFLWKVIYGRNFHLQFFLWFMDRRFPPLQSMEIVVFYEDWVLYPFNWFAFWLAFVLFLFFFLPFYFSNNWSFQRIRRFLCGFCALVLLYFQNFRLFFKLVHKYFCISLDIHD